MQAIIAFKNDRALADKLVARAKLHRKQDDYRKGFYWKEDADGIMRGCNIGCLAESEDDAHGVLLRDFNIPLPVSRLAGAIFEGMSAPHYKEFPVQFTEALRSATGKDLSLISSRFLLGLMQDLKTLPDLSPYVTRCIDRVIALYECRLAGNEPSETEWNKAVWAAREAWGTAGADRAAETDRAASAAWAAAEAASAAREVMAVWEVGAAREVRAAEAATEAREARAAREAGEAVKAATYEKMAAKLIELIKAA